MDLYNKIRNELKKLAFNGWLCTEINGGFTITLDWDELFNDIRIHEIEESIKKALNEEYQYYGYEILVEDIRESLNEESNAKYEFMYAIHFYRRIK